MENDCVYFYDCASEKVKEEHIFLNNFYESPFEVNGKLYKTVEHYYQAFKFNDVDKFEAVRLTPTPGEAKTLAHSFNNYVRHDWDIVKDSVMAEALSAKFSQNCHLIPQLLNTGNFRLIEYSLRDDYWGGVLEGSKNKLGELLMDLREKHRNQ